MGGDHQMVAVFILNGEIVAHHAVYLALGQSEVLADAVMHMHHVVAGLEVKEGVDRPGVLPEMPSCLGASIAKDLSPCIQCDLLRLLEKAHAEMSLYKADLSFSHRRFPPRDEELFTSQEVF